MTVESRMIISWQGRITTRGSRDYLVAVAGG
jgi:hypothetical protein